MTNQADKRPAPTAIAEIEALYTYWDKQSRKLSLASPYVDLTQEASEILDDCRFMLTIGGHTQLAKGVINNALAEVANQILAARQIANTGKIR